MIRICTALFFLVGVTGCATIESWFARSPRAPQEDVAVAERLVESKRTTRRTLEDQAMLGESSGSLWVGRGQQAYLFTNNNQRLLGDLLTVNLEGYPKEQIQTKISTISKLLAEILGEQKQEIQFKQNELKKKLGPEPIAPEAPSAPDAVQTRGLASVGESTSDSGPLTSIQQEMKQNEKQLKRLGDETEEVEQLKSAQDLPIKSLPTRIIEIQKDGNYRVRGEQPFMIGKREYKLLVMGTIRPEDYSDSGVSAETLVDPVFDIISEKKIEAL